MDVRVLLSTLVEREASDLYLTVDSPPVIRVEGVNQTLPGEPLAAPEVEALANALMTEKQRSIFEETMEMNLALTSSKLGRFRVNVFRQRGAVAVVVRRIKVQIPTIDELGLPSILKEIALTRRGLVLVTGATGSGKSTTQASLIDYRNESRTGHIVTVEDPIEFVHPHKQCLVSQREIGFDTTTYEIALKNAMRQAPDVILIGEVRDKETMEAAITFADTGHLCLATLHSINANQALERVINYFPNARHSEIFLQLSLNLRAVLSQRLVPGVDGKRVAAMEILLDTPWMKDLVKRGEIDTIKEAIGRSTEEGGQTFDQALLALYEQGRIGEEEALAHADSVNNLRIKIKNLDLRRNSPAPRRGPRGLPARPGKPDPGGLRIRRDRFQPPRKET